MKLQLELIDRERTIDVHHLAAGYRVVLDGHELVVDAVRVQGETWSLIVRDPSGGPPRSVEAIVVPQNGNGSVDVFIDGLCIAVGQRSGLGRRSRETSGAHKGGTQRVTAPMPGKVVRVLVKAGDEVQPRQGLVVVEAMKMENELRAAGAGRVRDVFVQEGQSVEAGTALVVVE
jgi:acetyl/propionyl-CoA carboxylase alpha subunit